jgi:hypothetical protein
MVALTRSPQPPPQMHWFERAAMRQSEGPAFISAALGRVERTPKTALRFAASPEAATIAPPWLTKG